jgi:hypothetical protein
MRVPYSVFKGAQTEVVKVYATTVELETHVPGSGANLA